MIVHVLRFAFREDAGEAERADALAAVERIASTESVAFRVIGQDLGDPSEGFTHAYCAGFADFDALRRYLLHPEHRALSFRLASRLARMQMVQVSDDLDPGLKQRIVSMHEAWIADDPELGALLASVMQ